MANPRGIKKSSTLPEINLMLKCRNVRKYIKISFITEKLIHYRILRTYKEEKNRKKKKKNQPYFNPQKNQPLLTFWCLEPFKNQNGFVSELLSLKTIAVNHKGKYQQILSEQKYSLSVWLKGTLENRAREMGGNICKTYDNSVNIFEA